MTPGSRSRRPKRVGLIYHPSLDGAAELTGRLAAVAAEGSRATTWIAPLNWDSRNGHLSEQVADTDLVVCVGGDGTVLHTSALVAGTGIPILAVRMGRLGFLSEATESEAEAVLRLAMAGTGRIEQRAMVEATIDGRATVHALNDVVIGRSTLGRTISVVARIDGVLLAEYRADAVIIASATGSTGYALSVGGPVLHPTSDNLLLIPVAPHLSRSNGLVLPGDVHLSLSVERGFGAVLTVDGGLEQPIDDGSVVHVSRSRKTVSFVRVGEPAQFYANVARRLGWLRADYEPAGGDGG